MTPQRCQFMFYPQKRKSHSEHLSSPLTEILKRYSADGFKWQVRLRILLLQVGGGMTRKIISDRHVWQVVNYADRHSCLRDKLITRLFLVRGFRTSEVCTLKAEHIDWNNGTIEVFDSKKKRYFTIPLDRETLFMLDTYLQGRTQGYVFERFAKQKKYAGKPLTATAVYLIIKRIAEKAGVKGFNPRWFRRYLAAFWLQVVEAPLGELQTIMRHKYPQTTWMYGNQFVFEGDVRREADRVVDAMFKHGVGGCRFRKRKVSEQVE